MPQAADQFLANLREAKVLRPEQDAELTDAFVARFADGKSLAKELIRRGWLTLYQANRILQGAGKQLALGPYILLDVLGEGGMGQVFKARHPVMDRLVALKLIKPDCLGSSQLVQRFQREIKAAAKLSHPNVVVAHDAAQVGNRHFYVMEFVQGTDLAKLVAEKGPLPVAQACDFIRQAALGLQHAHEHGLVHRDIKPGNLLVCAAKNGGTKDSDSRADGAQGKGVIKVLDLGLARLRPSIAKESPDNDLTKEGSVMGTPDYMAPEQAVDAAQADIRADIYSLGCTLYFLLTGQPPFPGGSMTQKLIAHQMDEPRPVDELRPEVPRKLVKILGTMLAKKPQERFQTPGEAAQALGAFLKGQRVDLPAGDSTSTLASGKKTRPPKDADATEISPEEIAARAPYRRPLWLIAGSLTLLVLVVGAGVVFLMFSLSAAPKVTVTVDLSSIAIPESKTVVILLDNRGITVEELKKPMEMTVGKHELLIKDGDKIHAKYEINVGQDDANRTVIPVAVAVPEPDEPPGELRRFVGHAARVGSCRFLPSGTAFYSCDIGKLSGAHDITDVKKWSLDQDKELTTITMGGIGYGLAVSRNERLLLLCAHYRFTVRDLVQKKDVSVTETKGGSRHTAFSPDERLALNTDESSVTKIWDTKDWSEYRRFEGRYAAFVPPDGKRLVTTKGNAVFLWDIESRRELREFAKDHKTNIQSLAVSPDGTKAATGGGWTGDAPDYAIRIWDLAQEKVWKVLPGHKDHVLALAWSPDSTRLASAGKDASIRIWDVAAGKELAVFQKHQGQINCLDYSPGGKRLLSASDDGTVRLWAVP